MSMFPGLTRCQEVDINDTYQFSSRKKIKACIKDYPFQINLYPDSKALHLYPEPALNHDSDGFTTNNYILFNPDVFYSDICGFYRLQDEDTITLGGGDPEQRAILNVPPETPARKLSIGIEDGWLTFQSPIPDPMPSIGPLFQDKKVRRVVNWRQKKLRRLREIFGNPIALLPPDEAIALLQEVNEILEHEKYRPKDKDGRPGGVVALPDESAAIIVGDLHAKVDNLLVVLSQNNFLEALDAGRATLVILGDAVHPEGDAVLDEMVSSMLIMDLIFKLKIHFPRQVFYVRGNHDSFAEEIAKHGIPQGLLWEKTLQKQRGKAYKKEMTRFYELLPYVAYSKHFVACHAAPPVSSTSLDKIINIRKNPKLYKELADNRLRQANRPSGYAKSDVKRFRKCLDLAKKTPVIVGHTCLSIDDTLWENVNDIE
ncbi:MAG: metallophosphoesterase, partial [Gammaproteobacteria bacterium]|nr:metallophosphoesterase [Gammaproteobacteria bacterium]